MGSFHTAFRRPACCADTLPALAPILCKNRLHPEAGMPDDVLTPPSPREK
jgi:hypothetical protein